VSATGNNDAAEGPQTGQTTGIQLPFDPVRDTSGGAM